MRGLLFRCRVQVGQRPVLGLVGHQLHAVDPELLGEAVLVGGLGGGALDALPEIVLPDVLLRLDFCLVNGPAFGSGPLDFTAVLRPDLLIGDACAAHRPVDSFRRQFRLRKREISGTYLVHQRLEVPVRISLGIQPLVVRHSHVVGQDMEMYFMSYAVRLDIHGGLAIRGVGFGNLAPDVQRFPQVFGAIRVQLGRRKRDDKSIDLGFMPGVRLVPQRLHLLLEGDDLIGQHIDPGNENIPHCLIVVARAMSPRVGDGIGPIGGSGYMRIRHRSRTPSVASTYLSKSASSSPIGKIAPSFSSTPVPPYFRATLKFLTT